MDPRTGLLLTAGALLGMSSGLEHAELEGLGRRAHPDLPGVPFSGEPGKYRMLPSRLEEMNQGCTCGGSAKRWCARADHAQAKEDKAASKRGARRLKRLLREAA